MARVRKIMRDPGDRRNHFVVDANFLANRFIPSSRAPAGKQTDRIDRCNEWWDEIEAQLSSGKARVYIPDICIAEAFEVLAKKYYEEKWFKSSVELNKAQNKLRATITVPARTLRAARRDIKYHDISTTRDIIISVDRFYELFHRHNVTVSLPDLILVSTAKYLLDFYDIPKQFLHLVTLDKMLRKGSRKVQELPIAYDPTEPNDRSSRVFQ